jgi:hypothetical protein
VLKCDFRITLESGLKSDIAACPKRAQFRKSGLRNRYVRFPPVSEQKVDVATLAHAYATCAIAFFKVSALSSKARASSCDISGQNTSLTPARPTTLGSDRVTP